MYILSKYINQKLKNETLIYMTICDWWLYIVYDSKLRIVFCKCQIFKENKCTDFEVAKSSIVEALMIVLIVVVLRKDDAKNVYFRRPR